MGRTSMQGPRLSPAGTGTGGVRYHMSCYSQVMRLGAAWLIGCALASAGGCGNKEREFQSGQGGSSGTAGYAGGQDDNRAGDGGGGMGGDAGANTGAGTGGEAEECVSASGGACPFGCEDGACTPDPCLSVVCDEPGVCETGPGECDSSSGTCSYPAAEPHASCGEQLECLGGECVCTLESCGDGCCSALGCGACTPTTLATRSTAVQSLTVSSPLLLFLAGDTAEERLVFSLSSKGGEPQVLSVPAPADASLKVIAADKSFVYGGAFQYDKVRRMPITGGVFAAITGGQAYGADRLLLNGSNVFASYGLSSNGIVTFPKAGGPSTPLVDSLVFDRTHFAVDQTSVYFITSGNTVLSKVGVAGGDAETVTTTDVGEKLVDVVVSGDQLVLATSTRVARAPVAGGKMTTLDLGAAYALSADATHVYYFRSTAGSATCASGSELLRVPLGGGAVQRVAREATKSCARSVVQDSDGVYWLADKSIQSAAK